MSFLDMFRRKKPPVVDLTNEAYGQWIRAQRPPFLWFMAQTREDREAMALIGDGLTKDFATAIGYAVAYPEAADAGRRALEGDVDAEVELVEMIAQRTMQKILASAPQRAPQPPAAAPKRAPMRMGGTGRK